MADRRKLLADIDKTLKKVLEGQKAFQDIYEKFNETSNQSQKEKYEAELKKEIKKLQRYREQIKSWQASSDIKDKSTLADSRKAIEQDMERFKVIEKETKTKAYSKEGLGAEQKKDPAQVLKDDTMEWVKSQISSLDTQVEKIEYDIELLSATGKKKKVDREKQEDIEAKKELIAKHKFHIQRLEAVMRMLDNDKLDPENVKSIQDDVEYYVNNNEDPDFEIDQYDEEMYAELDLEDIADVLQLPPLSASPTTSSITAGDMSTAGMLAHSPHDSLESDTQLVQPLVPPPLVTSSSTNNNVPSSPPVSTTNLTQPTMTSPLPTTSNVLPPTAATVLPEAIVPPLIQPSPLPHPPPLLLSTMKSLSPPPPSTMSPILPSHFSTSPPPLAPPPIITRPVEPPTQTHFNVDSIQPASLDASASSSMLEAAQSPIRLSQDSINAPAARTAQELTEAVMRSRSQSSESGSRPSSVQAPPLLFDSGNNKPADLKQLSTQAASMMPPTSLQPPPTPTAPQQPSSLYQQQQQPKQLFTVQIDPLNIATSTLRSQTPPRMQEAISKLDNGFKKLPHAADSERFRLHTTPNPIQFPSSAKYPTVPPPGMDQEDFYMKLDPQTLFFIFYYFEGTKAQYLAAKALKKMSWRFHTKYFMWFQRHEEPKTITEEYEKGAYVYYDFEKATQKKKDNFVFEYKFLEDKEL